MSKPKSLVRAADQLVGGVLSWVAGRDAIRPGRSAVDSTLGELASWTGLLDTGRRRAR
ncbi:MAG TPA: hypothetical protein VHZ97_19405 [Pseudonocardiaceae bacterium]|nr:hypothetical protein [Pseudonocardiaceae bacterium]